MTFMPPPAGLRGGFADPVLDSQRLFRIVLAAFAAPGEVVRLTAIPEPPAPLSPGAAALCLTLTDADTRLWLDPALRQPAAVNWLQFHCGCPLVTTPEQADFAVLTAPVTADTLTAFPAGTLLYPDRSATLIIDVASIDDRSGMPLSGPGIPTTRWVSLGGVGDHFWPFVSDNHRRYPLGVDLLCLAGPDLIGLPRSTRPVL